MGRGVDTRDDGQGKANGAGRFCCICGVLMTLPLNKPVDREARSTMRQLAPDTHYLKSNVTELRPHKVSQRNLATKLETAGQRRRQDPPQRIGELDLYVRRSSGRPLLIPKLHRTMGHYVNRFVRGSRLPGSRRISPACFRPSRLRMRHIICPQVVVPAIQSTPIATHSVATIAHLAFSLAVTILIPDCAPPQRLSPAFLPLLPPAPIYSSGRSRP